MAAWPPAWLFRIRGPKEVALAPMFHLLPPSFLAFFSTFYFHLPLLLFLPPYAVFLKNTPLLSDAVPRVGTLGWYALPPSGQFAVPRAMPCLVCVAPLGQFEQWHFGSRAHATTGHRVPTCRRGSVGANSTTTFSIPRPCPNGHRVETGEARFALSDGERGAQDEAAGGRWRAWRAIASS